MTVLIVKYSLNVKYKATNCRPIVSIVLAV